MYRKIILFFLALSLTGCGSILEETSPSAEVPGRMVQQIDISIHPHDEELERSYTDIQQMSTILKMLRDMDTNDVPEEEPDLDGGQSYYTVTATYANGESRVYYLLGHQFLCHDTKPWCQVDSGKITELIQYIRENPDDGSAPSEGTEETTVPEETSAAADPTGDTAPSDETTASE